MSHWDSRFIELAKHISTWSKDPSTQVGAVIVDKDHRIVSLGFNGFARGVLDEPDRYADRETKYKMVVHAESNALIFARQDLRGTALYVWPFMPCASCAAKVIQAGICQVVAPPTPPELAERWAKDLELTRVMFHEAGVQLRILEVG